MSKYKDCAVYVDANGRYCCDDKVICVGKKECVRITLIGMADVPLLFFPTGNTNEASTVHSILPAGITVITEPGIYKLDIDCEALDGTDAPADVAEQLLACCENITKDDEFLLQEILTCLKNGGATTTIEGDVMVDLTSVVTAIETLCGKVDDQAQCLDQIKAYIGDPATCP